MFWFLVVIESYKNPGIGSNSRVAFFMFIDELIPHKRAEILRFARFPE
jgi:hypothetical protein